MRALEGYISRSVKIKTCKNLVLNSSSDEHFPHNEKDAFKFETFANVYKFRKIINYVE